jgi:hypothetical protein
MIRPQAGLLLRSLGAVGARPPAMRSATSLLLGAALATAFFLLYTSLCRDIGDSPGSPPRWEQRAREAGAAGGGGGGQGAALLNPSKQQQDAASKEQEEGRKEVVTRGDGDGGHGARKDQGKGSDTTDNKQQQPQIVMPGTSTSTKQVTRLPLSPSFLCNS